VINLSKYELLGKRRLDQLDGLRGVCAIVVLVHHMVERILGSFSPSIFLEIITDFGRLAVYIFFVLSGFVIGYTTPEKYTVSEAKKYILRRLIRLYPIYLFAIFFSCLILKNSLDLKNIVGNIFFMQGWTVEVLQSNIPLWTLHYEFFFYLIFLFVWRFKLNIKYLIFFCFICAILSNIFSFHILEILGYFTLWLGGFWLSKNINNNNLLNDDYKSNRFWTPLLLSCAFIAHNILSMLIYKHGITNHPIPILCSALLTVPLSALVASLITKKNIPFYNISLIFLLTLSLSTFCYHFLHDNNLLLMFRNSEELQRLAVLLLLLSIAFFVRNVPVEFFKKISYLGSFSYALYVIHYPILDFLNHLSIASHSKLINILFVLLINALGALISITLAWFLECIIHVRIAKVLKKRFSI